MIMEMDVGYYKIEEVCLVHGISRQAYYQRKNREIEEKYEEEIILQMVMEKRKRQPKIGVRKLYYLLSGDFKPLGFKLGRDRLFKILRNNGLLVQNKRKYVRTTNSSHRFRIYINLIKEVIVIRPNQIIVGDITYIESFEGYVYLAILTDVYSRKIIGYDISESLSVEGSLRTLEMALKGIKQTTGIIHHSDRGIQYCCTDYIRILKEKQIRISMAEKGNPYENAIAERVNGILKMEFLIDQKFRTKQQAREIVIESIKIYNEERPHMSLGYLTPSEKYKENKAA